ncbi:hypothetical protein [Methylococcus sp. EFPC2]|uniref:hypothetical protein n=1 Tax=Methylococcus sp. EFPC2 TaxID=2812648 RepID=UPI0019674E78|nr:hypothetical protein [Methylococcus sp. EFPC2]QSA96529.1 hypothetical protein JWZ97_15080 [Methylococcus sp. EFPC2]
MAKTHCHEMQIRRWPVAAVAIPTSSSYPTVGASITARDASAAMSCGLPSARLDDLSEEELDEIIAVLSRG